MAANTNFLVQPFALPTPQLQAAPVLQAPILPSGSLLNFQPRVDVSAMQGSFRFNNDAPQFLFYPTFEEFKKENNEEEAEEVEDVKPVVKTRDAGVSRGKRNKKSVGFCGAMMNKFCAW